MLWNSRTGQSALDYGGLALPDQRRPTFVASDDAVILNETRSGWVWTIPDGALVASSQDWSLDERTDPDAAPSQEQLSVVIDPKPPVAVADAFGVRAGSLVTLPVLMNDHDPNEDVLSIDPASVTGLDPGFGTVSITDDSQRLTVSVAPGAERQHDLLVCRDGWDRRERAALAADDGHAHGLRRRRSPAVVRRRGVPRAVAGA